MSQPCCPLPCSPSRLLRAQLLALGLALACGGALAQDDDADDAANTLPGPETQVPERLPKVELTESILYQYLLAEIAMQRGDVQLAARTLADLTRRTRDPRLARRAVEAARGANRPGLAIEAARIWYDNDTASAPALQTLVVLLVGERRVEEAEPYLARLLASSAASAAGGFMQMNRLLTGNADKAATLRIMRRLAQPYPKLPEAHYAVAQAAESAGDEPAALDALRRASGLRPDWDPAALLEAQILLRRSPEDAAKRLARHLDSYPDRSGVRLSYARMLAGQRRYGEARTEFQKLVAANPRNAELLYAVGLLAHQMKDYPTAESSMKRALDEGYRDPDALRFVLGQIAEERKQWVAAIGWYEKVEGGDNFVLSRLRIAQAMFRQGRLEEARSYLGRIAVTDEKQQAQLIVGEAQLLRDAGRNADAFDFLARALAKAPEQPDLLYDYALTAEKLGRYDVLEAKLRRLIEIQPNHAHAYNALGYSYAERNLKLGEARKLIERALEISPEDVFIVDSMGWVLYREGDIKRAVEWLRRAYDGRADAEIGAHLGEALWAGGARDEARRVWDEALKNHPDNDVLQETVKRLRK